MSHKKYDCKCFFLVCCHFFTIVLKYCFSLISCVTICIYMYINMKVCNQKCGTVLQQSIFQNMIMDDMVISGARGSGENLRAPR